jgi:methionyl-tRNA synthetase
MEQLLQNTWVLLALVLWTLPWKGVALWRAAHNDDKKWFIALLVVNTLGLLEIAYIFYFGKLTTDDYED